MATPYDAPYKNKHRKFRSLVKNRGEVLHVSCQLMNIAEPYNTEVLVKRAVQCTRIGSFKR